MNVKYRTLNDNILTFIGTDPKSVVCAFFKQGQCTKGDRCKFSHDLSIERKAEKRSLYCDMRDDDKETDTMDKWDEDKLKEVVEKKHGGGNRPTTDIVSIYAFHNFIMYFFLFILFCYHIRVKQKENNVCTHFRFVNIFWKQWRRQNMVGFGNVHRDRNVSTGMHCQPVSCLRKIRKKKTRRMKFR